MLRCLYIMKSHCNYKWEWLGSACLFLTCNYYKVYHLFITRHGESQYCSSARNDELPAECTGLTGVNQKLIELGARLSARELNLSCCKWAKFFLCCKDLYSWIQNLAFCVIRKQKGIRSQWFYSTGFSDARQGSNRFSLSRALLCFYPMTCQTFKDIRCQFNKRLSMCLTIIVLNSHWHGTQACIEDLFWITLYYYIILLLPQRNTWMLPKRTQQQRQNYSWRRQMRGATARAGSGCSCWEESADKGCLGRRFAAAQQCGGKR